MYAKFTDSDVPQSGEACASGSVNFANESSEQIRTAPAPAIQQNQRQKSTSGGIVISFKTLAVIVGGILVILCALTLTNFYLVIQLRADLRSTSDIESIVTSMSKISIAKLRGNCPVFYNSKCFFVTWREKTEFIDGENICKSQDGLLANIYDDMHFNMIKGLLKNTQVGAGNFVWLGMTYNSTSRVVSLSDGSQAGFNIKWYRDGHPINTPSKDRVGIRHRRMDTSADGFINGSPGMRLDGALCEIINEVQ